MLSSNTWIISSGIVVLALLFKTSLQSALDLSFPPLPFLSCLKPVFVINGIIFAVAATWRLYRRDEDDQIHEESPRERLELDDHLEIFRVGSLEPDNWLASKEETTAETKVASRELEVRSEVADSVLREASEHEVNRSQDGTKYWIERPLVRRLARQTHTVSRLLDEQNDTLDETWKMITAAKSTQPIRHQTTRDRVQERTVKPSRVLNLETAKDRKDFQPPFLVRVPTWLKIKKELALSSDEVDSRAEALIRNFKEDMRLQRRESLKRFQKLCGRAL